MGFLRFAIKSSIAGGFVYCTIQEGLWGNPEESPKLYNKLYTNISPLVKKNVPEDVINEIHHIPNPSDLKVCASTYWNKGVTLSIRFLADLPTHISNGIEKLQKEFEKSTTESNSAVKIDSK